MDNSVHDCQEDENFIQTKFGYCFYSLGDYPLIYNLYVHPQYRRCGHSRMLLQCVISEIRKTGYDGEIYIQAKPQESSIKLTDLIKYYESMGLVMLKECEPK